MPNEKPRQFKTDSGIEIRAQYTPWSFDYREKLGNAGEFPFTRGVYPDMYRTKLWTMRQYAGFGTAKQSNERYRYLLANGTTGLSVAFDLPTQMGYDSDHPLAEGEVGKVGVAINTLADVETLFDGIRLQDISTSMTINATAAILLCMYVALAKKQHADLRTLSGTIQNDILKEYIARGTYIYPPRESMRLVTDIFSWCSEHVPGWNTISISGYHIREAGSTAVQEIAFTLANAREYVAAAVKTGLSVDQFAPRLSFFFNAHNNLLEEVAKFRAARRLWASIMKNEFGAKNPDAMRLRFHAQTGGSTLAAQQIDNNVPRTTLQALAAVLGGCQSLHVNGKDEALALPTEETARLALRTQQIIAFESGVAETVDPLAGSYFIEHLTDETELRAKEYLAKIDALGGAVRAIEAQYYQSEIAESAYQYQKAIDEKRKTIVGVNAFQIEEQSSQELLEVDESIRLEQIERLKAVKDHRDGKAVKTSLVQLHDAAVGTENVVPRILQAVESYASIGEISDALREAWGEYGQ
ncbi:MAG TPA: methylmalonyl-CoA mutase family protein [Bacteroidota bacterium]|nr:methylmalonyl-CoA mutase family protein [Bacteroidota bacterium]